MEEEFKPVYDEGVSCLAVIIFIIVWMSFVFWGAFIETTKDIKGISILMGLLPILVFVIIGYLPSYFRADESSVTFSINGFKTRIPYSSIKSIETDTVYREDYYMRYGTSRYYAETIKIVCGEKEYSFGARLDIDYEGLVRDPDKLAKEFQKGKFIKLKKYIEQHMNT